MSISYRPHIPCHYLCIHIPYLCFSPAPSSLKTFPVQPKGDGWRPHSDPLPPKPPPLSQRRMNSPPAPPLPPSFIPIRILLAFTLRTRKLQREHSFQVDLLLLLLFLFLSPSHKFSLILCKKLSYTHAVLRTQTHRPQQELPLLHPNFKSRHSI